MPRELHPACAAFPQMSKDELEKLAVDIASQGLLDSIVVMPDPDGRLLDGRNRDLACEMSGVTPRYTVYTGNDPIGFVISKNERRRHLPWIERVAIAEKLANINLGDNQHTMKEGGSSDPPSNETKFSREQAAKSMNVSAASVKRLRTVNKKASPVVVSMVMNNQVPLETAYTAVNKATRQEQETWTTPEDVRKKAKGIIVDPTPELATFSKAAQDRLTAWKTRYTAYIESTLPQKISEGVRKHIDEVVMPIWGEKLRQAELILNSNRKPFTNAEFLSLLRALHPDSTNDEYRNAAFILLKDRQIILRPEEKDFKLSADMPKTVEEMLARRKVKVR